MYKGFPDYVNTMFPNQIRCAAEEFLMQKNIRKLPIRIRQVLVSDADLSALPVIQKNVSIPLRISADVTAEEDGTQFLRTVHLSGLCTGQTASCFEHCEITVSGFAAGGFSSGSRSFSPFFLPRFSGEEAESQTERLLQLAFGCLDVQRRPQKIEPACIARALGFRIQLAALTESGSLPGRCVFADADVQLYDTALRQHRLFRIPGRTILLEQRLADSAEAVRAAIAREIVHAYFYRLAYAFFAASRRNIPSFRLSDAAALIRQTDRRTDQLAMCILMPREAIRQKTEEYRAAFSGQPESAYRRKLIRHTAVFFGVSDAFCAARLQMLGLLRPEAEPAAAR